MITTTSIFNDYSLEWEKKFFNKNKKKEKNMLLLMPFNLSFTSPVLCVCLGSASGRSVANEQKSRWAKFQVYRDDYKRTEWKRYLFRRGSVAVLCLCVKYGLWESVCWRDEEEKGSFLLLFVGCLIMIKQVTCWRHREVVRGREREWVSEYWWDRWNRLMMRVKEKYGTNIFSCCC